MELLVALRTLDEKLLNSAYAGARRFGNEESVALLDNLGLDLRSYKKALGYKEAAAPAVFAGAVSIYPFIFAFLVILFGIASIH